VTTGARRTPALLTLTATVLMALVALARGLAPFSEPDIWWHLRVGEHILDTHQINGPDPWAGFAGRPYMATQWLAEAVAAQAYRWGGMGAVLWLRTAAILALALVVYVAARRLGGRLPAALATGVAILGASASLNPRPQLVSFLMFAITVGAWLGTAKDGRVRWWLIPLYWLWACCHGLWVFGILVGVVTSVALVCQADPAGRRRIGMQLLLVNAGTTLAVALTPLGPGLLTAPFTVADNAASIAEEWAATPLSNAFSITTAAAIMVTALCWLVRPARRPWWQYAWLGLSAALTLYMWRLVPLGAILCAPLLAGALQSILTGVREGVDRRERVRLLCGLAAALLVAGVVCAGPAGPKAVDYPTGMGSIDRALSAVPQRSVVMNDFGISGWMLWTHPQLVPVADLRVEIYPTDYLTRYIDAENAAPGWEAFIRETGARYALVERRSAIGDALVHEAQWAPVATSTRFVLLSAPGALR
jgi:hypothetical protein